MVKDFVLLVWSPTEERWKCCAVSRHYNRIRVCAYSVLEGGGRALLATVPFGDVEAAEAAATSEPPPELSFVDVVAQAVRDGLRVSVDLDKSDVH